MSKSHVPIFDTEGSGRGTGPVCQYDIKWIFTSEYGET